MNKQMMSLRPQQIQNPSPQQKIVQVSNNNNLAGMGKMQGAPFNIYDTVLLAGLSLTTRNSLTFFSSTNNKSKSFTNYQQSGLQAGETLAAQFLQLQILQLSAASVNVDTTTIQAVIPFGTDAADEADKCIALGTATLKIANKTIFKDFQLIEALPYFNPANAGVFAVDGTVVTPQTAAVYGRTIIELPTIPVILPNMPVELILNFPAMNSAPTANRALMVTIGRQGSIFNATQPM